MLCESQLMEELDDIMPANGEGAVYVTRFYRCLGYVLVVLNLSIPKIIIS